MQFMAAKISIFFVLGSIWNAYGMITRANDCMCDKQNICNCSAKHLPHVPSVPRKVLSLDLSLNDIETLDDKDLSNYAELRILNIYKNKLSSIYEAAFKSQLLLKTLDLSYNQLTSLSFSWFEQLGSLQHLNLLGNKYKTLGPDPLFQPLKNLNTIKLGNPYLEVVRKHGLSELSLLNEMVFHGSNLKSYEEGSFSTVKPIGSVTLSLHNLFLKDQTLVSKILHDVSKKETSLIISDAKINSKSSVQPFEEVKLGGTAVLTLRNITTTDEEVTGLLQVINGAPLSYLACEDILFIGGGWWTKAKRVRLQNLHTVFVRNLQIENFFSFSSMMQLSFLLKNFHTVSVINSTVFVMPCLTSHLLSKLEFLDLSQNLLSDLTMKETLCDGSGALKNLRTLNVSQNSLKSLGLMSHLVARLNNLNALDLSYNTFIDMPEDCVWPAGLSFLNLSATKLFRITPCLPQSLTVLDLSNNDLTVFQYTFPHLTELIISGNKFIRIPGGILFPSLETLFIQRNTLNMFSKNDLKGYKHLQYLEAGQNNFVCTCEFVAFLQHDVEKLVKLQDGPDSYVCDSPLTLRGNMVQNAQLSLFECHMIPAISILCAGIFLTILLLGFTCHKLHVLWYLRMTWAWIQAKRRPAVSRSESVRYDAFVSYSEHDAEWVEEVLVPELEGNQPPFALCLHKRDFQPGRWIVDNIIDCIEKSHCTLYVLSEHFVTSEWCRYELDFSHFRLIDEKNDSAVLILLEPIEKETIPKRFCKLRKVMNSKTYLEWPEEEEKRAEFWHNLKAVLQREESSAD